GLSSTCSPLLLESELLANASRSPPTHELPPITTAAEDTATATPAVTTLALRPPLLPDSRSSRREGNSETVMYGCSPKKKGQLLPYRSVINSLYPIGMMADLDIESLTQITVLLYIATTCRHAAIDRDH